MVSYQWRRHFDSPFDARTRARGEPTRVDCIVVND